MPQVRPKSEQKHSRSKIAPVAVENQRWSCRQAAQPGREIGVWSRFATTCPSQLTKIQINTAGLSGPYRSDEETMEMVRANHAAVRQVRIVLRRAIVVARRSPLLDAYLPSPSKSARGNWLRLRVAWEGRRVSFVGHSMQTVMPDAATRAEATLR